MSYSPTAVVSGPSIPLNGLEIYYDFSNPKSYPGSGNTVYNLGAYKNVNATLSGSIAGGLPTFVSDGLSSHVTFVASNEQFMFYTLPTWGPSFTNISVFSSITSPTWSLANNEIGEMGGIRWLASGATTTNGFIISTYPGPGGGSSSYMAVEAISGTTLYYTNDIYVTPASILVPNLYYQGYDHSTGHWLAGNNDNIFDFTGGTPLPGRGTKNNSPVYFSRLDPRLFSIAGDRFTNAKLYLHMLYNRKLSASEINMIYRYLKTRMNTLP